MNNAEEEPGRANRPPAAHIDVEKLAEKVYRLMQADLRLARKRGVKSQRRR